MRPRDAIANVDVVFLDVSGKLGVQSGFVEGFDLARLSAHAADRLTLGLDDRDAGQRRGG